MTAVRTGVGKSGISSRIWRRLRERGIRAVDIRHPMPYRDLSRMRVERYASLEDLDVLGATIEEREEYEHLIELGAVVFAGVDYADILAAAEKEAQVVIWDGGNNDMPFIKPDLDIVALDPHRPGHERLYHPGEANFLRGDVLVVNKVDSADPENVAQSCDAAARFNPDATVIQTKSATYAEDGERMRGKRVLAIEDGPTVTHGGMAFGAAALAAREYGAAELVDPRPWAVGSIRDSFANYPHLTEVLPAVGYSEEQLRDLEATIAAVPCDVVAVGTPIDLGRLVKIEQPSVRVTYRVEDASEPTLDDIVDAFLEEHGLEASRRPRAASGCEARPPTGLQPSQLRAPDDVASHRAHLLERTLAVARRKVDGSAPVLDDGHLEAQVPARRVPCTSRSSRSQARTPRSTRTFRALRKSVETRRLEVVVVEERAVGVDPRIGALVHDVVRRRPRSARMERRARCVLDAVRGPENLLDPAQVHHVARRVTGMVHGEAPVVRRGASPASRPRARTGP